MKWSYIERSLKLNQKSPRSDKHFNKVAGYKINIQKPVAFLYNNNK
jgi:hypothetical protein